jgi:hypothetical protein
VKDIYEELERMFNTFHKDHMKILLGDRSAKVGKEDILKLINGNGARGSSVVKAPRCKPGGHVFETR